MTYRIYNFKNNSVDIKYTHQYIQLQLTVSSQKVTFIFTLNLVPLIFVMRLYGGEKTLL